MNEQRDAHHRMRELSERHLGPDYADQLVRSAVWLSHGVPSGRSRLGGNPLLPPGSDWPTWGDEPLNFLALVDCAEITALDESIGLPRTGFLNFFCGAGNDHPWGLDPDEADGWRVIHTSAADAVDTPAPDGAWVTPAHPMRLTPSGPEIGDAFLAGYDSYPDEEESELPAEARERLDALVTAWAEVGLTSVWRPSGPAHQIGGWPEPVQEMPWRDAQFAASGVNTNKRDYYRDPGFDEVVRGIPEWRLLLQVDTDSTLDWQWGDFGRLYFVIRADDLRAGDFGRVWMTGQCY
ncbi:YwqG family protein [Goodfellowiella coeruleoviolacea]|uniref:Uncharacterized protein YwqG n=1 Tax=Goodfellowiella coeruleoviolacea TaxID=334858 RepID=A0AAE3GLJ4_9PSEU|nr:YwqG family protein [Goodfellowiella coeruleoviolacea]MCP2169833.1 Uncharacterized protein YwqG [Goodfellowiella coeruleoviolacea]